jgi:hypothetical protein
VPVGCLAALEEAVDAGRPGWMCRECIARSHTDRGVSPFVDLSFRDTPYGVLVLGEAAVPSSAHISIHLDFLIFRGHRPAGSFQVVEEWSPSDDGEPEVTQSQRCRCPSAPTCNPHATSGGPKAVGVTLPTG